MNINRVSDKQIVIQQSYPVSKKALFEYISQPHKMRLWLANDVRRTSKGFDIEINLPMYTLNNSATIINNQPPDLFEFVWNSEYVMDTSVVSIKLDERENSTMLQMTETGDFDKSRWSNPQSIHIDIWKEAFLKLREIILQ